MIDEAGGRGQVAHAAPHTRQSARSKQRTIQLLGERTLTRCHYPELRARQSEPALRVRRLDVHPALTADVRLPAIPVIVLSATRIVPTGGDRELRQAGVGTLVRSLLDLDDRQTERTTPPVLLFDRQVLAREVVLGEGSGATLGVGIGRRQRSVCTHMFLPKAPAYSHVRPARSNLLFFGPCDNLNV